MSLEAKSDPGFLAFIGMRNAMERVSTYEGLDGFWYALIRVRVRGSGCYRDAHYLEGPFEAEDQAQEGGLRTALEVVDAVSDR